MRRQPGIGPRRDGVLFVVIAAACGSRSSKRRLPTTAERRNAADARLGTGVTARTIKLGVCWPDYSASAFVDRSVDQEAVLGTTSIASTIRWDQRSQIVRPTSRRSARSGTGGTGEPLCTAFTEDDHVFAVVGSMYDFVGRRAGVPHCADHTPLITDSLTQDQIDLQGAACLLLTPDITADRRFKVIMSLVK